MSYNVYVYKMYPDYASISTNYEALSEFFVPVFQSGLIKPGDKVVLKPNMVKESHLYKSSEWEYIITHTEVIKFVLRKVIEQLNNRGEIFIVDAPQTDSDYAKILENLKLPGLVAELQATTKVPIKYYDLREERWYFKRGIIVSKKKLPGDPKGYVSVNLGDKSEFHGKMNKNYYGADYDTDETNRYHNDKDNIYIMSRTVLDCDVFINLPKIKTHKLAGMTGSLKNLVGTCVIKNSIPHHTIGIPKNGGDKFPCASGQHTIENSLKAKALKILKHKNPIINYPFIVLKWLASCFLGSAKSKIIRNGAWYGNDTIWRATLDLNKIIIYADANGQMHDTPQRKYITFMDGVIGGEKEGPMAPEPKYSGVLISAMNPVSADVVAATLMGFDYRKIPTTSHAYEIKQYPIAVLNANDVAVVSNKTEWNQKLESFRYECTEGFKPHYGWVGNIEMRK